MCCLPVTCALSTIIWENELGSELESKPSFLEIISVNAGLIERSTVSYQDLDFTQKT